MEQDTTLDEKIATPEVFAFGVDCLSGELRALYGIPPTIANGDRQPSSRQQRITVTTRTSSAFPPWC